MQTEKPILDHVHHGRSRADPEPTGELRRWCLRCWPARPWRGQCQLRLRRAGWRSNVSGELLAEAGAAIAVGVEVESNASGQVITKSAGIVVGVARDAATAAGQKIRIIR